MVRLTLSGTDVDEFQSDWIFEGVGVVEHLDYGILID